MTVKTLPLTKRFIVAYGTRPELIKLAPVIFLLRKLQAINLVVLNTGQHREMVNELELFFGIKPDICFDVMKNNQSLNHVLSTIVSKFNDLADSYKPDAVIVQGDTTTVLAIGIAAFYKQIKVAHVEAGLRSFDIYNPYPEEVNRKIISLFASWSFTPTKEATQNLLKEGVNKKTIHQTGNTVVDALQLALKKSGSSKSNSKKRKILVTAHRRENHGHGLISICNAINTIINRFPEVEVVFPVHPNPNVTNVVYKLLGNNKQIKLSPPLPYSLLVREMKDSHFIMTDSGGIQEEAPSLKKPVLILRNVTERPEVIYAGFGVLVGTNEKKIISEASKLLKEKGHYQKMISGKNPFGDGKAAQKIVKILTTQK